MAQLPSAAAPLRSSFVFSESLVHPTSRSGIHWQALTENTAYVVQRAAVTGTTTVTANEKQTNLQLANFEVSVSEEKEEVEAREVVACEDSPTAQLRPPHSLPARLRVSVKGKDDTGRRM